MSAVKTGNWKSVELREVGKIVTGSTPPKARREYYGGNFPFAKPGELLHGPVGDSADHLSDAGSEVADVAPAGSVLVSCIGNLGKTGLATRPVAFNQQINAIFPHAPEYSKWIFYAVQTPDFASQLAAVSSATTIAIVNKGKFSTLRIPLAPQTEQRRIVAKIEKQFTRLDAGVAALRRVQANLKRYRAAVLKAACEGRLVPTEAELAKTENRKSKFETGEALLARILAERRKNWQGRGKYKEPAAPHAAELTPPPEDWTWASPEQLSSGAAYALAIGPFGSNLKVSDYTDAGVPLVFVRNIRSSEFGGERTVFVSKSKAAELRAHHVSGGDILITKMGEPPGDACLYPDPEPVAVITADCIKLRLAPLLPQERFFVHAINSETVKPQIQKITKGVAQMKVSLGRFSTLAIPLPPLAEQTRIVAEVERRLSVVEELEAAVSANLQRASRLRQSILQRAFAPSTMNDHDR